MNLTRAETVLVSLTAAVCVFLFGFFTGRSGTRGVVTVQTNGLRAPVAAETPSEEPEPEPVSESQADDPEESEPDFPLDLNAATAEDLTYLPGIGEVLAQRIVDFRAENGPFRIIEEIKDVRGIGDTIFDGLKDYITVG